MKFSLLPESASTMSSRVDHLYLFLTGVSVFFLLLIFVPMLWFLFKYRHGHPADRRPLQLPTTKIEITWTVIPLLLALVMFGWAAHAYYDMEVPPRDTMEINVVAKQWMWKIQHLEGNREINELHVPVHRPVKLIMSSEDVIHSFYIPAFRIKQDVVPGKLVTEWFEPTRPGRYHLFCAEYCGTDHSKMIGTIYVQPETDYQDWLNRGKSARMAETGGQLFRNLGCSGCHEGVSAIKAPPLAGLFGRRIPLQDGNFVTVDDQYLRDSILLPNAQIAAGYQPLMPTYQSKVTEEELFELIAYLKSLGGGK